LQEGGAKAAEWPAISKALVDRAQASIKLTQ
jgi:hypothetical protein